MQSLQQGTFKLSHDKRYALLEKLVWITDEDSIHSEKFGRVINYNPEWDVYKIRFVSRTEEGQEIEVTPPQTAWFAFQQFTWDSGY